MTLSIASHPPLHKGSAAPVAAIQPAADGFAGVFGALVEDGGKILPPLPGADAPLPPVAAKAARQADPEDEFDVSADDTPVGSGAAKTRDIGIKRAAPELPVARLPEHDPRVAEPEPRRSTSDEDREAHGDRHAVPAPDEPTQTRSDPAVAITPQPIREAPVDAAPAPKAYETARVAATATTTTEPMAESRGASAAPQVPARSNDEPMRAARARPASLSVDHGSPSTSAGDIGPTSAVPRPPLPAEGRGPGATRPETGLPPSPEGRASSGVPDQTPTDRSAQASPAGPRIAADPALGTARTPATPVARQLTPARATFGERVAEPTTPIAAPEAHTAPLRFTATPAITPHIARPDALTQPGAAPALAPVSRHPETLHATEAAGQVQATRSVSASQANPQPKPFLTATPPPSRGTATPSSIVGAEPQVAAQPAARATIVPAPTSAVAQTEAPRAARSEEKAAGAVISTPRQAETSSRALTATARPVAPIAAVSADGTVRPALPETTPDVAVRVSTETATPPAIETPGPHAASPPVRPTVSSSAADPARTPSPLAVAAVAPRTDTPLPGDGAPGEVVDTPIVTMRPTRAAVRPKPDAPVIAPGTAPESGPLIATVTGPTTRAAIPAARVADPAPVPAVHSAAAMPAGPNRAPAPIAAPAADPVPPAASARDGTTIAPTAPTDAPAAAVGSVPVAEPRPASNTGRPEAPAATPAPATTRVAPQPLAAAPLDTAARLVARPAPTPRATPPRIAAVAEPSAPTLTTAAALATTAGAATPSEPTPVDMAHAAWPSSMIHRIERMRDEADAVSTTIRLIPDALGAIDVKLKQDGEVTHVHLVAEQPQTRVLLADAAPKLAELAEQRGLKLGDAQVQSGPGSNGGQQSAAQHGPRRPTPSPAASERAAPSTPDHRIA